MSIRTYVKIWILLSVLLAWECYALNFNSFVSLWALLRENAPLLKGLDLNPSPGKTISLWYGWTGIGIMLLTNPYILRKRWAPLRRFGSLSGWLDFHIFCGLMGPTFIFFHSNFKVGGLVAISFWSMTVSFSSGIIGRYFYMQLVKKRSELEDDAETCASFLAQPKNVTGPFSIQEMESLQAKAVALAGGSGDGDTGIFRAIARSFIGDLKLRFKLTTLAPNLTAQASGVLKHYAKTKRRILYLAQFQKVMGYWHSFHLPFAVFMYLVAAIHIAVALLLRARH